jgi:zinc ribbon protein
MAFCTSCGATLEGSAKFCTKCGAAIAGTAGPSPVAGGGLVAAAAKPAAATAPSPAAPASGGGALKVILLVVAIIIAVIVLGGAVIGFGVWRLASRSHVETGKNGSRIETPFGSVESNTDPTEALKKQGIDIYPGARPLPGSASVNFGGMNTLTAQFETPDSPDLVEAFYKARFPRSNVNVSDQNQRTIVFATSKGAMNIVIEPSGSMTRFVISNVGGVKASPSEPQPN